MKIIKILIVIIIILAIVFGIKVLGPKKSEIKTGLTLEEVKEIVAKSENIDNYECEYKNGEQYIKRRYNNKKEFLKIDENKYYTDYEKNETIGIVEEEKTAIIMNNNLGEIIKEQRESLELLLEKTEEYNYIGEEKYNEIDCIVIELKYPFEEIEGWYWGLDVEKFNQEYKNQKIINKIWIAKEEGVILKVVSKLGDKESVQEFEFEFNCVSDEEVEVPDLSGYEIIDTRKK